MTFEITRIKSSTKITMKVEIDYVPDRDQFFWNIYDGPDGIDTHEGIADTLGEAFEQIVRWRAINALHYQVELPG